jgi:two-component system, response regulator YesN
MYKLIIIEDEYLTRKSLVNEMPWEQVNCNVIGEADDGTTALDLVSCSRPDIVISDIRMDGMDGLELCRQIKENYPEIQLILLTGYGEFGYAQTALKLGVKDFILKPTDPGELLNAVRTAIKAIEKEIQKRAELARMEKLLEQNIPVLREKFLQELLGEVCLSPDELNQRMDFLKISQGQFFLLALELDEYEQFVNTNLEQERQLKKLVIQRISQEIIDGYHNGYILVKENNTFVMLVYYSEIMGILDIAESIQKRIGSYLSLSVSIGISLGANGFQDYRKAYNEAVAALRHKFYLGEGSIVYFGDIQIMGNIPFTNGIFENGPIIDCIKVGDLKSALEQISRDLILVRSHPPKDYNYIRNAVLELIILIERVLYDRNSAIWEVIPQINFFDEVSKCDTLDEIQQLLEDIIRLVAGHIQDQNQRKNNAVTETILAYLRENYAQDISLDDLSKLVYMNPKYICRLLKKETGLNFLEILTEIRINKAKELLKEIRFKTYEIAQMVGINDARYFSQMFKKIVGMTPTEFREGKF